MTTKTQKIALTAVTLAIATIGFSMFSQTSDAVVLETTGKDVFIYERESPPNIGHELLSEVDRAQIREAQDKLSDFLVAGFDKAESLEERESAFEKYPIHYVGKDVENNALRVGIDRDYMKYAPQIEISSSIREVVGTDVNVVFEATGPIRTDACSQSGDCEPIEGGVKITVDGIFGSTCSAGFQAEYDNYEGFITAGHCGEENEDVGQPSGWWFDDLGLFYEHHFENGSYCDCGFVKSDESVSDEIYSGIYPSATTDLSDNDTVNMEGYASGGDTGTVIDDSITVLVSGNYLYDQVQADYDSTPGDSGGAVYITSPSARLVGIHSAADDDYTYYSKASRADDEFSGLTWDFS